MHQTQWGPERDCRTHPPPPLKKLPSFPSHSPHPCLRNCAPTPSQPLCPQVDPSLPPKIPQVPNSVTREPFPMSPLPPGWLLIPRLN